MTATGARRGGLIYHWRHGWIPLDHYAALSKAHHSKSGAVKVMQKHGIDVPKGYKSDHKGSSSHGGVKETHPIGATVAARQPGIFNETHGRVVGHADNGMIQVAHAGHNGKPLVGTFNPSHTRVIATGATTHTAPTPHPAPHTLKPGEHATVRGIDHMGQPTTFTGKVTSNGEVSSFSKGRTTGGQPLRSISIERQDNSKRQNVVYVPDPNRGEQKRGTAANAHKARATELRAAAARKRAEADHIANGVGAPDRAGAMLRAKDSARMNARMDSGLRRFTEKQREAKALESKANLAEGRAKTATEKQAASDLALTAAKLSPGDMIQHNGQAHMVTKVNRTTVSVPSIVGGPWEDKLPIGQVSKHVKLADMKESTLRTLMSRAKGNAALQGIYMAELKRRGLPL